MHHYCFIHTTIQELTALAALRGVNCISSLPTFFESLKCALMTILGESIVWTREVIITDDTASRGSFDSFKYRAVFGQMFSGDHLQAWVKENLI
jgi:hypothetical protein